MEKYYLISGKALINVNFRTSKRWLAPNEEFGNEIISESELKKYKRFLEVNLQVECDESGEILTAKAKKISKNENVEQPLID